MEFSSGVALIAGSASGTGASAAKRLGDEGSDADHVPNSGPIAPHGRRDSRHRRWADSRTIARRWGLLPLRLIVGVGFMAHGLAKLSRGPEHFGQLLQQIGAPLPVATAWLVTLCELLGGFAILLGVLVALASIPLIVSMLVAMFTVQLPFGFSSVNTIGLTQAGPVFGPPGYEINLLYIASLIALAILGPGPLAVQSWINKALHRPVMIG